MARDLSVRFPAELHVRRHGREDLKWVAPGGLIELLRTAGTGAKASSGGPLQMVGFPTDIVLQSIEGWRLGDERYSTLSGCLRSPRALRALHGVS
jgi:hypothetical protein